MLKQVLEWMSPVGPKAKLSVLFFHRVLPGPDPLFPEEVDAPRFDQMCGWLARWFNVLALDQAVAALKVGSLPARAVCITFDDGYADNHDVAMPILKRHGLPATIFVATGFLDGGWMWNDGVIECVRMSAATSLDLGFLGLGTRSIQSSDERRSTIEAILGEVKFRPAPERIDITMALAKLVGTAVPNNLMMTSAQVRAMYRAGMQIGAHTVNHPILGQLPDDQVRQEVLGSKEYLEQLIGERVGLFAYPNGKPGKHYSEQTVKVIRSMDLDAALCTQGGATGMNDDLFQIRRFTPWDKTGPRFLARMHANLHTA